VLDGCQVLVTKTGNGKKTHVSLTIALRLIRMACWYNGCRQARVLQYLVELLKFHNYTKKNRFIKKSEVQQTLKVSVAVCGVDVLWM
jgi:hypothetical protein